MGENRIFARNFPQNAKRVIKQHRTEGSRGSTNGSGASVIDQGGLVKFWRRMVGGRFSKFFVVMMDMRMVKIAFLEW